MNWKSFLLGTVTGLIGGYCLHKILDEQVPLSAEKVLADVKQTFKKDGSIDGSWMQMKLEEFEKYPVKTKVYRGGITRTRDGEKQQFEFIADAYTGTILDVNPI